MDIDQDEHWPRYEKASDALSEARANFKTAEHNYMLALQQLRRAEAETSMIWHALVERAAAKHEEKRTTSLRQGDR